MKRGVNDPKMKGNYNHDRKFMNFSQGVNDPKMKGNYNVLPVCH